MESLNTEKVVNVASVQHRSPFRYPGGKTWLVPHVRKWLQSGVKELVEPFAGGAIVGLSALFDGLAERVTLIELDDDVAAVWKTILNGQYKKLTDRIVEFEVSLENVRFFLDAKHKSQQDKAFATILKNRMQRGGILAAGATLMKHGENGKGLLSRWYPETLQKRILDIGSVRSNITFIHGDGMQYIREHAKRKDCAFFIDPPYTVAGRRLYTNSEIDHEELFKIVSKIKGDFLMTYDNTEHVRSLAERHGFDVQEISMKNTHHAIMSELLIGKNLSWARS